MTPDTDHMKPLSNSQKAISALREMIVAGELAPGSDHLESELADRLGMSRTPIREAALTLESQGLLELRPRKGVRILPVAPSDMAEIYDILTELESMSARQAAEKGLTDDDLTTLARSIEDMDDALKSKSLEAWADADQRFHRELVALGGNMRVMMIFEMMSNQVKRARAVTLYIRPLPLDSNKDHRMVLEAIQAGDSAKAETIHRTHRQAAKDLLLQLLATHRLKQI